MYRLVELNYKLGLENESKKYAIMLGYNYQSSDWYEKSYKILNKEYKDRDQKWSEQTKSLLKRFKDLFQ